jgi:hypothetical protein
MPVAAEYEWRWNALVTYGPRALRILSNSVQMAVMTQMLYVCMSDRLSVMETSDGTYSIYAAIRWFFVHTEAKSRETVSVALLPSATMGPRSPPEIETSLTEIVLLVTGVSIPLSRSSWSPGVESPMGL